MKNLNVLVVGAGIGGLQTALALASGGHQVAVFESVKEFQEVGAGIRVPPNSSRLSLSWGVDFDSIKKVVSSGFRFLDWKDNKVLLDIPLSDVESRYGAPYYFIHRADLINILVDATTRQKNIVLRLDSRVVEYDFDSPALKTADGQWHHADLIVCADGIRSSVRNSINDSPIEPVDTGDVAYRILVPAKPLLDDPQTRHLVTEPWAMHWLGPEGHAVGYPLREGELYNIIIDITHSSDLGPPLDQDEWKSQADNTELVRRFADWCYPVRKLCSLTGQYLKWKLADFDQLQHWVHPSGKVALLGDASHPMMPYMAQGAAQATEDAATLQAALAHFDNIPDALRAYEKQRRPRAAFVARNTRVLQQWWHLYDGPEQERRDELMKYDNSSNPIYWGESTRRDWLFGHDARKLLNDDKLKLPGLPPYPVSQASVYINVQTKNGV
ncbi:uncharacterized protein Z518_08050 [Rhinocladiella mackenziei CBS 650.93]|uniref:FAD-binding domain-containing protein n=1 Tax=Rhinocladiella mackenziei CBS 650.93 TaxID=1442369 RepID=A0A0D2IFR6_9EURO|nr:uncharacterized protein Z518_08050 [Rhinocladiella mackenziei CBS 650.93]KIX02111.1 hypothetical protein Z518_08050 [Rhinocladiella mackenziei CBS 650.93]